MELLLNDLLHSNFNQLTDMFTTVSFFDGDTYEELNFVDFSYDGISNSLRLVLKK